VEGPLSRWLSSQSGRRIEITSLERIAAGHSRANYRVATDVGERLVVRVEQGGVFGTNGEHEAALMRELHGAGLPVARVRWEEPSGEVLGRPFFVMDEVAADRRGRSLPPEIPRALVRTLDRVHREGLPTLNRSAATAGSDATGPAGGIGSVADVGPADATRTQVDRWLGVYRSAADLPVPLLEEAAAWLRRNTPRSGRVVLVHGDAGPDNMLHRGTEVVAVTDWEFAHAGDAAEDWVSCAAVRGVSTLPVGAWRALIAEEAGWTCDDAAWRYWEAFNLFKAACADLTALALFERGDHHGPDMAIMGTSRHQVFLRRLVDLVG
jgi:aminoglycoside phosphotransferase (APT) family kinase protein